MDNSTENMKMVWSGRVLSTILMLPFLGGIVMSVKNPAEVSKGMAQMGFPETLATPIMLIEIFCIVVYAIPQTAILGAILFTGYMGGAIVTHLRVGEPAYMQLLIGMLIWLGVWLRDSRLRALIPWRR